MEADQAPLVNGSVLRAYLEHVQDLGLEPAVRARLSPGTLKLLDKPPLALSWIDAKHTNELAIAVFDLRGRDAVREMGLSITGKSIARLLRPLIATSMTLFGATPGSVFSRVETFSSLMVRHAEFTWETRSESSGAMTLAHGVQLHEAAYALWEGVFLYAFELTGRAGKVGVSQLLDGGRRATLEISWE